MHGIGRRSVMLGVLTGGCAPGLPTRTAIDDAAEAEMARRPDYYVNGEARAYAISRGGRTAGTLWGTWHVGYSGATVMPASIRRRFEQSATLSVEEVFDRLPPGRVRALQGVFNRGLHTHSSPALAALPASTRDGLEAAGFSPSQLEKLSLAGIASAITAQANARPAGLLPTGPIVDVNLIRFARGASIPVYGLEQSSPAAIERMLFRDPNGPEAAASVAMALRRRTKAGMLREWMERQYEDGATARLLAGLTAWEAAPADLARSDAGRAALLTDRNRAWISLMEARMTPQDGPAFFAFGCAHLPGTAGVVALLRNKGWEVTPCVGDRCEG